MRHIKLNAIGSTNDYLKELAGAEPLAAFTVVSAESQTAGRGQMGAQWISEPGKNLTMSVLLLDAVQDLSLIFDLNIAVALGVIAALEKYEIPELALKWPNDIMSGKKKIGGILLENSVKSAVSVSSIAGIGINVNQQDFDQLPQASSLWVVSGREFELDTLIYEIVGQIKANSKIIKENPETLRKLYYQKLFRRDIPTVFEDENGNRFMGMVRSVALSGKLLLELEDESVAEFGLKELKMLY